MSEWAGAAACPRCGTTGDVGGACARCGLSPLPASPTSVTAGPAAGPATTAGTTAVVGGRQLEAGSGPAAGAGTGRRGAGAPARAALVVGVLAAVAAGVGGWVASERAADRALSRADGLVDEIEAAQSELDRANQRLTDLEAEVFDRPGAAETADRATASVYTIVTETGGGSGWVAQVSDDRSLLVTNFHVIQHAWESGSRTVTVVQQGRSIEGRITEVAAGDDLALVEVDEELTPLPLTDEAPRVGDAVIVIGSPLGLEQTVVTGIVSAFRDGLLQFSAPISPGNSGGPVLNTDGEVIGVAELKVVDETAEGLGFAIPVEIVCRRLLRC